MIRQCGWCKILMGEVAPLKDTRVTHGICQKCEKTVKEQIMAMEPKK